MDLSASRIRTGLALGFVISMALGRLDACPFCDSPTARQVRDELAGEGMVTTLAAMLSPFAVLLIGLRIYGVGLTHFFRSPNPPGDENP